MVFGDIRNLKDFPYLEEDVRACLDYAAAHDLAALADGSYPIDGDRVYFNINSYETTQAENRVWEAHRKHLDLHLMLRGREQMDGNFTGHMKPLDYVEQNDFLQLKGEANSHVILDEGNFLVCYPSDAHRTAVQVGAPAPVKKAIFKIRIR